MSVRPGKKVPPPSLATGQTGCECSGGLAVVSQGQLFFIAGRAFVFATSLFCKPAFRCSQFQKGTQVEVVLGANLGLYPSLIQDNLIYNMEKNSNV